MNKLTILTLVENLLNLYQTGNSASIKKLSPIVESTNKLVESILEEKWGTEMKTKEREKGKWEGWTITELKKRRSELKKKEDRSPKESKELRQINFALRAKTGWGKVKK